MQRAATVSQVAALVSGFDPVPAYRGLAEALRVVITDGRVPAGVRLPSERQLTAALGVSRTTVARAYAELRDHGFLVSRQGSGWVTMLPQARGRRGDHLLPAGDQPHGKIDLTMAAHAADPCILDAYRWAVERLPGYLAGAGYHPAGLPVFAIARPHPDAIVSDVEIWSVRVAGWGRRPAQALTSLTEATVVPDRGFDGAALLVPVPQDRSLDDILDALVNAGVSVRSRALVGGHARRYMVSADGHLAPVGQ